MAARNSGLPVVLMLVDGLGYEAASRERTPNLHRYASSYPVRPLRPVLGYSDTQRAVLFTGRSPDAIGYWMLYRFAQPHESPWRRLRLLAALDRLPAELPRKVLKLGLSATLLRAQARLQGYDDLNVHNIPFRALPWSAPTLRGSMYAPSALGRVPTIFDLLRAASSPFGVIRSDTVGKLALLRSISRQTERLLGMVRSLKKDTSFVYCYIHSPDMFAHRFGIRGREFWDEVGEADRAIAMLIEALKERLGPGTQVALVSDHGMDHTERFVSFQHLVRHPGFGRDFVAAIDSTMVRLRYLSADGPRVARPLVESSGVGAFLTDENRRGLGIAFPGEQYGDDVYLLEPGNSIYPNFHSLLRPKAMHAYHPNVPNQQATAMFIGDAIAEHAARKPALEMTDVFPIVCSTLGVETLSPT